MQSFESLIAMLLTHEGYWTATSVKVNLTKEDKQRIGRASCPRWEIDVLGYRAKSNELLVVECKSLLDSTGVLFQSGKFVSKNNRYKLFSEPRTREVVCARLTEQLTKSGH